MKETIRVVTRDLLDAPAAEAYVRGLANEPRVFHPTAASPFTFGIITSSFGDAVVMDDRASMVEALHERVIATMEANSARSSPPASIADEDERAGTTATTARGRRR